MGHYTYKITFQDTPYFYFGSRTWKEGEDYWGSPVTYRWVWDTYEPEKQILEWFETREEANELECRLIRHFLNDPNCLNQHYGGGVYSTEAALKANKAAREKGVGWFDPECQSRISRRRYELGIPPPVKKGYAIEVEVTPGTWKSFSNCRRFCEEFDIRPSAVCSGLKRGEVRIRRNGLKEVYPIRKVG